MSGKLSDVIKTVNNSILVCGSLAGLALLGLGAQASAQESAEVEEVVVTGIRSALKAAIDVKRNTSASVDAISAEDIGKFPDKNVAESLQRIPGVTIQRQFGEGNAVSIRGAGTDLTLTTLNGQNVASTGWFVFQPAARSFNFELLPSELVADLEVYKSSQADLAEGGVGGTVVVNTRKPLDLPALAVYGSVEASHQSDSDTVNPQLSGLVSWRNSADTFGVLIAAVAQERELSRKGSEAFWEWGAGPVAFEQDRKRQAVAATFQLRPSDNLDIVFNAIDMQMEADNVNYAVWLTQGNAPWSGQPRPEGDLRQGTAVKGPLGVAYAQARPREATMKSEVFDLTATYAGLDYELTFQVGKTSASGGTDFEMVLDDLSGGTAIPGGTYDHTGSRLHFDVNGFDVDNYAPGFAMGTGTAFNKTPKTDEETYFQVDFEKDLNLGPLKSIKTGARYSDHNTTSRRFEFTQGEFNNVFNQYAGRVEVGSGQVFDILRVDADAAKAWAKATITGQVEDLGAYSEIDEANTALYVMGNFAVDAVRGNLGLRYVQTDATSTYYLQGRKTNADASYSEVLPSFNLVFDLSDDLLLRTSAARVLARPQYVDMYVNPNVTGTNDDLPNNQHWIVGNIGLKPFVGNQFDLGLEWYFAEGSMLSAAFFTKDIKNFVTFRNSTATAAEIPFPLTGDEAAFGWTVQEKENGRTGSVNGFEVQYQQDYGNGFGSLVNYTYTDTNTEKDTFIDQNRVLSDSSRHAYNVTGYYEGDLFQVRLSYNWRSEYMLREVGSYGNRLHDDYGSLDLSAAWFLTDSLTLKLDASNLLEEGNKQFGNNNFYTVESGFVSGFPLYQYELARRINLGLSVKF